MCLSAAARVIRVDERGHEALVDMDGSTRPVSLAVLSLEGRAVEPGDWVLVHTGFAVELLDQHDVDDMLALRAELRGGPPS